MPKQRIKEKIKMQSLILCLNQYLYKLIKQQKNIIFLINVAPATPHITPCLLGGCENFNTNKKIVIGQPYEALRRGGDFCISISLLLRLTRNNLGTSDH